MRKNTIIEHRDKSGNLAFVYQFDARGIKVQYYEESWKTRRSHLTDMAAFDFVSWEELFDENRHWHGTEDRM